MGKRDALIMCLPLFLIFSWDENNASSFIHLCTSISSKVLILLLPIDREVKVIKFRGDQSRMTGIVEVRGIVNKDGTISYGEFTQYDNEFGKLFRMHFNFRPRHSRAYAGILSRHVQGPLHQVRGRDISKGLQRLSLIYLNKPSFNSFFVFLSIRRNHLIRFWHDLHTGFRSCLYYRLMFKGLIKL